MWAIILETITSLLEKIGLLWISKHRANEKSQEVANAPITNQEEADGLLK